MRRVGYRSIQREGCRLRALYTEVFEDHLRMALIRHGDSVIVVSSGYPHAVWHRDDKKGGTAIIIVPFRRISVERDFLRDKQRRNVSGRPEQADLRRAEGNISASNASEKNEVFRAAYRAREGREEMFPNFLSRKGRQRRKVKK